MRTKQGITRVDACYNNWNYAEYWQHTIEYQTWCNKSLLNAFPLPEKLRKKEVSVWADPKCSVFYFKFYYGKKKKKKETIMCTELAKV